MVPSSEEGAGIREERVLQDSGAARGQCAAQSVRALGRQWWAILTGY